jgi:hypothetical protein
MTRTGRQLLREQKKVTSLLAQPGSYLTADADAFRLHWRAAGRRSADEQQAGFIKIRWR